MMIHKLKIFLFFLCLLFIGKTYSQTTDNENIVDSDSIVSGEDETISIPNEIDWNLTNLYSWHVMTNPQKEGDCVDSSINPEFTDQEYIQRLSQLQTVIELPYNKIIRSFIDFYLQHRRDQVERMLGLSSYYFPIFEAALDANNMPLELKYLPVIESALNPLAFSKTGASGLWQFMIGTGKIYGLNVNSLVDERRDPLKSTNAGVRYLKDLYNIYNDWNLAIAAYNCGPGNVNKAIRRAGGKKDYWKIYYYLPKETRGYVPAFIAANYIMNYYSVHNLCPVKVEIPLYTDTIMIQERLHLLQVAEVLNIPIEELRSINPQYRKDIVPGNMCPYALCLPLNYTNSFIERKDSIFAYKASEFNNLRQEVEPPQEPVQPTVDTKTYKVRLGDHIGKIAKRYGVSISNLKKWNHLKSNNLKPGARIIIHAPSIRKNDTDSTSTTNSSIKKNKKVKSYKVKQGDTLLSIAHKFDISLEDIKEANHLTKNKKVKKGQVLKIPKK